MKWIRQHLSIVRRQKSDEITENCEYEEGRKHHLIEQLQNHQMWKSMRFWEACFRDDAAESSPDAYQNCLGKLPNFLHNMRQLRIGRRTCVRFLQKQAWKCKLSAEDYTVIKVALLNM